MTSDRIDPSHEALELGGSVWFQAGAQTLGGASRIGLLAAIGETGSITSAAKAVGMSYKGAWDAVDTMNNLAGEPLVVRSTGGKGGGGTTLTPRALKLIDTFRWTAIDENLTGLANIQGACERIKNTPLPRQFDYLPRVLVDVFCWLLPLAVVEDLGLMTPLASTLISFTFIAADLMSREIANPFDNTIHDTPMTALSRTIELNLREQMQFDERPLPQPVPWPRLRDVQPVDGFVF